MSLKSKGQYVPFVTKTRVYPDNQPTIRLTKADGVIPQVIVVRTHNELFRGNQSESAFGAARRKFAAAALLWPQTEQNTSLSAD